MRKELYESEILKGQTTLLWQLSRAKESAIPESAQFSTWLEDQLNVLFADELPEGVLDKLLNDKEFHLFSNQFFPLLDTGIEEITVKTEKYKESETAFRRSLDLWTGEDKVPVMNNLALNLAAQGATDQALTILYQAQKLQPDKKEIERNIRIIRTLSESPTLTFPKKPFPESKLPE